MIFLWQTIKEFSKIKTEQIAIAGVKRSYSWFELYKAVLELSEQLKASPYNRVALYADNSSEWIVVDLACQLADVMLLPLPAFFSDEQLTHAIKQAGVQAIIHQGNDRIENLVISELREDIALTFVDFSLSAIKYANTKIPSQTSKVTFTSGSTGQPKGVCLSARQQEIVAKSLLQATGLVEPKHLSILPFSTLLENVGGIYAPLLAGGSVVALPQAELGFNGSNHFDLNTLLATISRIQPNSMILLPELLLALLAGVQKGWEPPTSLDFIAVGGSKVSPQLLEQARTAGLPVFEGYGLSECASVVSVNSASDTKLGSVGKPLDHLNIEIENDEIVVSGNNFLGYINDPESWSLSKVYTGDLGYFDELGNLHINGRKKNLIISSFGRNISPEWLENELLSNGLLQQCIVIGDARPYCIALVSPYNKSCTDEVIALWIKQVNQSLPNYAQIMKWKRLMEPFSFSNGLMTSNGRPIRDKIMQEKTVIIEQLYEKDI